MTEPRQSNRKWLTKRKAAVAAVPITIGLMATPAYAASCGDSDNSNGTAVRTEQTSAQRVSVDQRTNVDDVSNDEVNQLDLFFVEQAARSGLFEVQSGDVATVRSGSEDVQAFGEQMVQDHLSQAQDLEAVADQLGITLPTSTDSGHARILNLLSRLQGSDFDHAYVPQAFTEHQKAVGLFLVEAEYGENELLRDNV